jgi:uridine phosphorylase
MNNLRVFYETAMRGFHELAEKRRDPEQFFKSKILNAQGNPHHIPAGIKNLPKGTIMFLPGSPGRARAIAEQCFDKQIAVFRNEERAFHTHYGKIKDGKAEIPVAAMPSHMGFGTLEIAVNELVACGIETIIRVGTSGAMREEIYDGKQVSAGDIVIANPARFGLLDTIAHLELPGKKFYPHSEVDAALCRAGAQVSDRVYVGETYSKSLLYNQEFLLGSPQSALYNVLQKAVLAAHGTVNSEMEAALLYATCDRLSTLLGKEIKAGAFCVLVGEIRDGKEVGYVDHKQIAAGMKNVYAMVRQTTCELYQLSKA